MLDAVQCISRSYFPRQIHPFILLWIFYFISTRKKNLTKLLIGCHVNSELLAFTVYVCVRIFGKSYFRIHFLKASFCVTWVQGTAKSVACGQTRRKHPPSDKQSYRWPDQELVWRHCELGNESRSTTNVHLAFWSIIFLNLYSPTRRCEQDKWYCVI